MLPSAAPRRDTYNSLEQASSGRDTNGQPPTAPRLISPATKQDSLPGAQCQAGAVATLLGPELIGQHDTALSRHTSQDRAALVPLRDVNTQLPFAKIQSVSMQ